jgi:uncharacterized protein (TIGR02217 family)
MNFHEIRFPASLSFGSIGGPERRTDVVTLANGYEERNTPWAHSRRRYDAGVAMRSLDDVEDLVSFFEARQGQLYGFRWKDWSDFKSGRASAEIAYGDQVIGTGDGTTTVFQLSRTYRSGAFSYVVRSPNRCRELCGSGLNRTKCAKGSTMRLIRPRVLSALSCLRRRIWP